jgi:hypothetical protein
LVLSREAPLQPGKMGLGETIRPAQIVPVIHMKGKWNDLFPLPAAFR